MSVEAIAWALKQKTDEAVDKLILIGLADHAGEDHVCWPHRSALARVGMCSMRTVDRANARLEARGLIRKTVRMVASGGYTSNLYVLAVAGPLDIPGEDSGGNVTPLASRRRQGSRSG